MRRVRGTEVVLSLALALAAAASTALGADYALCAGSELCVDDPAAALRALSLGHIGQFYALQPPMGIVSLLLRLPFAGPVYALHGNELLAYRAGAFACLLAVAALGVVLAARQDGVLQRTLVLVAPFAIVVGSGALYWGHPEEPLAAVLCIAAVMLAHDAQPGRAGVAAGLAVATKGWALLAIPVGLVAVRGGRHARFATAAVLTATIGVGLMFVGNPARFEAAARFVTRSSFATPFGIWWPFASGGAHRSLHSFASPARMLILVVGIGIAVVRRRDARQPLALLAIVLLARAVLDPSPAVYYYAPAVLAAYALDAVERRPPLVPLAATGLLALVDRYERGGAAPSDSLVNVALLACVAAFGAFLWGAISGPQRRRA